MSDEIKFQWITADNFKTLQPPDNKLKINFEDRSIDISWGRYKYRIGFDQLERPEKILMWIHHLSHKAWEEMTPYRIGCFIEAAYRVNDWKLYEKVPHENEGPRLSDEERTAEREKLSPQLRLAVLKRDRFRCRYCGASSGTGVELHIDHIVPVAKGGKTDLKNLQSLCKPCNYGKGAS